MVYLSRLLAWRFHGQMIDRRILGRAGVKEPGTRCSWGESASMSAR
jgi:hypothetical protein